MLNDNKNILIEQIDFIKEKKNINRFRESSHNIDWLIIPEVYDIAPELSNIIVMKYIDGIHFSELDKYDKEQFSKLVIRFSLVSLLYNNAVHCDLHSGNIIFIKEYDRENIIKYKLGIIDYGIVVFPSRDNQNDYYNFINSIFINKKFTLDFLSSSLIEPQELVDKLSQLEKDDIISKFNTVIDKSISMYDFKPKIVLEWSQILIRYGLKISTEANKMCLSLLSCGESVRALALNNWIDIYINEIELLNGYHKLIEL